MKGVTSMKYNECMEFVEKLKDCKKTLVLEIIRSNNHVKDEVLVRKVIGEEYNYPEIQEEFPKYEEYLKKSGMVGGQTECMMFVKPLKDNDLLMERANQILTACMEEEIKALEAMGEEITAQKRKELNQKYAEAELQIVTASNEAYLTLLEERAEEQKKALPEDVLETLYHTRYRKVISLGNSTIFSNNNEHSEGCRYVGKIYSVIM